MLPPSKELFYALRSCLWERNPLWMMFTYWGRFILECLKWPGRVWHLKRHGLHAVVPIPVEPATRRPSRAPRSRFDTRI
jgi:hypothetical protein